VTPTLFEYLVAGGVLVSLLLWVALMLVWYVGGFC